MLPITYQSVKVKGMALNLEALEHLIEQGTALLLP